jgi:hypothetical protein
MVAAMETPDSIKTTAKIANIFFIVFLLIC